jgi:hypothetical protein
MAQKAEPDVCTVDTNKVKQDYSSLLTSNLGNKISSAYDLNGIKVNGNQVWTSIQAEMSGQVTANLVYSEKQSSPKRTATKPAVHRTSSRIREAPVTKSDAFFVVNKFQSKSCSPKDFNAESMSNLHRLMTTKDDKIISTSFI